MSFLDSILGAVTGKANPAAGPDPLGSALQGLLAQNGGLQGLMSKFTQSGHGDIFSSWIGMDENKPVTPDQIHQALGADQVQALAAKLGVDPTHASGFLAEYLPKIVDKLTPTGQVEAGADHAEGLAALLPSLLSSLGGGSRQG